MLSEHKNQLRAVLQERRWLRLGPTNDDTQDTEWYIAPMKPGDYAVFIVYDDGSKNMVERLPDAEAVLAWVDGNDLPNDWKPCEKQF
jgi:hypothetical protein